MLGDYQGGGGSDVVLDFDVDHDMVQIQQGINGLAVNSAADIAGLVSDDGGNALIDFGNGDTLTYSASNLPSGASFDAGSRTFTWTVFVTMYPVIRGSLAFR